MLQVTTIASGSSGNAALVSCGSTHILLDAGISARRITTGLQALGLGAERLSAIFITHEHHDHVSGLGVLCKKVRVPIIASGPTCQQLCQKVPALEALLSPQPPNTGIALGELWVESFATPHDAAGSVGYAITGDGCKLVLATDLGHITPQVTQHLAHCDLFICEANHDEDWVRSGGYPYYLKQRILGDHGHLSNEAGAELAALAVAAGTRTVVLAHLSSENNTPARAREVVASRLRAMGALPERDVTLSVAPRSELGAVYTLERGGAVQAFPQGRVALC